MASYLGQIDHWLFLLLNGRLTSPLLDKVMPFVTTQEHWYPLLLIVFVALLIWGGRRGRIAAVLLIVAVALADQISCSLLKPIVGRIRPCNALPSDQVRLLVGCSKAFSFPSAHAANSFAMASVVSWGMPKLSFFAFLLAIAVAYSRVYVGVHYPLDVLGGAVLGLLIGGLLTALGRVVEGKLRQRRLAGEGTEFGHGR